MEQDDETEKLAAERRTIANERWREANAEAIEAYNRMIEEDGFVFSDGVRTF